ncbi:MAG: GntR family transcriptional regulator [Oscillospiraceae bacterium]
MNGNFRGDQPIYAQLVEQLTRGIVSGSYAPGERLPSVRELALQSGVNPNTMQRAFAELERIGLVGSVRTTGRFVTEDEALIRRAREQLAGEQVSDFLKNMRLLGFSKKESVAMVESYETEENEL